MDTERLLPQLFLSLRFSLACVGFSYGHVSTLAHSVHTWGQLERMEHSRLPVPSSSCRSIPVTTSRCNGAKHTVRA